MFTIIRAANCWVCGLEEKNWSAYYKTVKYRAQELAKSLVWHHIKATTGWSGHDANKWVHCSQQNFDLPETAIRFWRTLVSLQQQMTWLRKSTIASWAEQKMPTKCHCTFVYHPVTLSMTMGQNLWWLKTMSYENMCITVMLAVLADHSKLPPYLILNHNTMPKEQLPRGIIFRCQPECWMTNELTKDRLSVVWNEGARDTHKKMGNADHGWI
jgi:hypothetical protein